MFDVSWTRPGDDEVFECRRLTPLRLARRLKAAVDNFGEVTIVAVEASPPVVETIDLSLIADAVDVNPRSERSL